MSHSPPALLDELVGRVHIVDPDAEMVEADEILAPALRGLIGFEIEQRQPEDAVGQEHAFGQARIGFADDLEAEEALVELGRRPGIAHRHGEMADLRPCASGRGRYAALPSPPRLAPGARRNAAPGRASR